MIGGGNRHSGVFALASHILDVYHGTVNDTRPPGGVIVVVVLPRVLASIGPGDSASRIFERVWWNAVRSIGQVRIRSLP